MEELSEENKRQLFIPRGFAHGFIAATDDVIFQYKVDNPYNKESERSINPFDKDIGILWRLFPCTYEISEKDRKAPLLRDIGKEDFFDYYKPLYN